jgi:hypothetical protein
LFLGLFNDTLSTIYKANGKMIMNDGWERTEREAARIYFQVVSQKLSGEASVKKCSLELPNTKHEF